MIPLLIFTLTIIPILLINFMLKIYGKNEIVLSVVFFTICLISWQWMIAILYATALPIDIAAILFKALRFGQIMIIPAAALIIYSIILDSNKSETLMRNYRIFLGFTFVWTFTVYIVSLTNYGISDLTIFTRDSFDYFFPVYGSWHFLYYFHMVFGLTLNIAVLYYVRTINNFYLRKSMIIIATGILLGTFSAIINPFNFLGLFPGIISIIIMSIFFSYAIFSTMFSTLGEYKNFSQKILKDKASNVYSSEFVHELKNQLTIIKGSLDIIANKSADEKVLFLAKTASAQVNIINEFSNNFKVYMEEDNFDVVEKNIKELIQQVYFQFNNQETLKLHISGAKVTAYVNEFFFKQMIFNIMKNSIEESIKLGHSSCYLHVTLYQHEQKVHADIQDSNNSITNSALANPHNFFNSDKEEGFGIGLNYCKRLALKQFGNLEIIEESSKRYIRISLNRYPMQNI